MNRRKFLILAAISVVSANLTKALASTKVYVEKGKLGYKNPGPLGRQCKNCKHFESKEKDGICKLKAMQNVMKSKEVYVLSEATCNMWISK